jgi:hypothetical protein
MFLIFIFFSKEEWMGLLEVMKGKLGLKENMHLNGQLVKLKLHFNEENMVTLKHKVLRLVGSDFGDRKEAIKGTPECVPLHLFKQ